MSRQRGGSERSADQPDGGRGAVDAPLAMPSSVTDLEREIQARRDRLASTIDELTARAKPKEMARRGALGVQRTAQTFTHTPEGQLRTERLAAVVGAALVIVGVFAALRLRRR